MGAFNDGGRTHHCEVNARVIAEGIGQAGKAVGFAEVGSFHVFSCELEGDARDVGATDVEGGVDAAALQLLEELREGPSVWQSLCRCDGLVDQGSETLFLAGNPRALRKGALLPPGPCSVQTLSLMRSSASGGAGHGLEAELLLEDSEGVFDSSEVPEMLPGKGSVGSNPRGDNVDMFVRPIVVLYYGIAVPPHLSGDIRCRQKPALRCEVFTWEQGYGEVANGFGDPCTEGGDGSKLSSQFFRRLPRKSPTEESSPRFIGLLISE